MTCWFPARENIFATFPKADVNMTTAADFSCPGLGHEGDGFAVLGDDFLETLLEDDVHVSHWERQVIDKIQFVLAAAPFTFAAFDGNSRSAHLIPNLAKEQFVASRLHGVIIDPVIARWRQVPVLGSESVMKSVVEEKEFQFAGEEGRQPLFCEQVQLA